MSNYFYTAKLAADDTYQGVDWRISFFNLVDFFKLKKDIEIVKTEPTAAISQSERALLQSIVSQLCYDALLPIPKWAYEVNFLSKPWFVCEINSLYAFALKESPLFFRRNNIFVLNNFMSRC